MRPLLKEREKYTILTYKCFYIYIYLFSNTKIKLIRINSGTLFEDDIENYYSNLISTQIIE